MLLRQSQRASSADVLRGFEGKAATIYFSLMRQLIPSRWGFHQRAYHPPPDPWNATLSFGYSLLLKDVLAAVELVGLDAYVGFFHALEANRPSLALDLMEEFRPLVDDAMLRLLFGGHLPLARYRQKPGSARPVEIGSDLLPVVIEGYETALAMHLKSPQSGISGGRSVIEMQVRQMAELFLAKRRLYQPAAIRFQPIPNHQPARR
jgi:CRISPR-associated protein Cas1